MSDTSAAGEMFAEQLCGQGFGVAGNSCMPLQPKKQTAFWCALNTA